MSRTWPFVLTRSCSPAPRIRFSPTDWIKKRNINISSSFLGLGNNSLRLCIPYAYHMVHTIWCIPYGQQLAPFVHTIWYAPYGMFLTSGIPTICCAYHTYLRQEPERAKIIAEFPSFRWEVGGQPVAGHPEGSMPRNSVTVLKLQ